MIIRPNLPSGYTIFCDDVREEVNGKSSIIGIYGGEIAFPVPGPVIVPQLAFVIAYWENPDLVGEVAFKVIFEPEDGNEIEMFKAVFSPDQATIEALRNDVDNIDPEARFVELRSVAKINAFQFPSSGTLKVRAFRGDDEIHLGAIRVKLGAPVEPQD